MVNGNSGAHGAVWAGYEDSIRGETGVGVDGPADDELITADILNLFNVTCVAWRSGRKCCFDGRLIGEPLASGHIECSPGLAGRMTVECDAGRFTPEAETNSRVTPVWPASSFWYSYSTPVVPEPAAFTPPSKEVASVPSGYVRTDES